MILFTIVLNYLVLLLCKVVNGGGGWDPLEAEIIPPGQDDICQCGQVNEDQDSSFQLISRVIGGTKTPPNRFPWLAGLYKGNRNEEWDHFCGGALISSQHILTAAHCVEEVIGPGQVRILLGGHSRKYQSQNLRTVSNISIHDDYNVEAKYNILQQWAQDGTLVLAKIVSLLENDIAILTLENRVS